MLALVGGSAGLSVIAQGLLHKVLTKWPIVSEVRSKIFSFAFVQLLTAGAALAAYATVNVNLSLVYPWLATSVAFVHRFFVSPYYETKILPYLQYQASKAATPAAATATPAATAQTAAPATATGFVS